MDGKGGGRKGWMVVGEGNKEGWRKEVREARGDGRRRRGSQSRMEKGRKQERTQEEERETRMDVKGNDGEKGERRKRRRQGWVKEGESLGEEGKDG